MLTLRVQIKVVGGSVWRSVRGDGDSVFKEVRANLIGNSRFENYRKYRSNPRLARISSRMPKNEKDHSDWCAELLRQLLEN